MWAPCEAARHGFRSRLSAGSRGRLTWLALMLFALAAPAAASQIRSLNLEQLADRADRIFSGRVMAVQVGVDTDLGQVVTTTTFRIDRGLKGDLPGRITIRTLGGQVSGHPRARGNRAVRGMPQFRPGEEVVLFLYGDSQVGLTSPVGFGQGLFSIVEDGKSGSLAINGYGNRDLLRGLSRDATDRIGNRVTAWPGRGPVPTAELLDTIEVILGESPQGPPP